MRIRLVLISLVPVFLCACGGGGGSGSPDQNGSFSSFANVQPGQSVRANGLSQTQNVTLDSSGTVTAKVMNVPDQNGVSALWSYGLTSPLVLTGIEFAVPRTGASVGWHNGRGTQTVTCGDPLCFSNGDGARGALANALGTLGWNFQAFGYWLANTDLPADIAAAISAGRQTAVGGVPTTGSAITYNGLSGGIYVSSLGVLQEHAATVLAIFDPVAGTIAFSTTGTTNRLWNSGGGALAAAPNFSTTLTYDVGSNLFTGTVTVGPVMTPLMRGTVTGTFYGPGAEEIGGTFELANPSDPLESMTGSFGGKR
jgi:hypothetical protein